MLDELDAPILARHPPVMYAVASVEASLTTTTSPSGPRCSSTRRSSASTVASSLYAGTITLSLISPNPPKGEGP